MLRASISDGDLPSSSKIQYCNSPKQLMNAAVSGNVDAACIWEPYSTILLKDKHRSFKRLIRRDDSEEYICCALAAGNHLDINTLRRIAKIYDESMDEYRKSPEKFFAPYSAFMGFDEKLMRTVAKEYTYPAELDYRKLSKQFEHAGIKIPLPSSVKEAVLSA